MDCDTWLLMSLKQTISTLAETFASEILKALRSASLNDLTALEGVGTSGAKPARRGPGRPKKAVAPTPTARTSAKLPRMKNGARRTKADVEKVIAGVVGAVKAAGDKGIKAEGIYKSLGLTKKDVQRPILEALSQKLLKKKGVKRATTYYAV